MKKLGKNFIEFDIIGVDASIANAIRRVIIAEVLRFLYALNILF